MKHINNYNKFLENIEFSNPSKELEDLYSFVEQTYSTCKVQKTLNTDSPLEFEVECSDENSTESLYDRKYFKISINYYNPSYGIYIQGMIGKYGTENKDLLVKSWSGNMKNITITENELSIAELRNIIEVTLNKYIK